MGEERASHINDDGLGRGYDIFTPPMLDDAGYLHAHVETLKNLQHEMCDCCPECFLAVCHIPNTKQWCKLHDDGRWEEDSNVEYEAATG